MAVLSSMTSLGDVPPGLDRLQIPSPPLAQFPEKISPRQLPAYIQPCPERFTDADIAYIRSKGALDIPHERLRNETVRCYFEYIHPFLPLLDPAQLLIVVDNSSSGHHCSGPQLSLLLFHSVMFAAVPFVDESLVREAGYANLKIARKAFFQKAKLLYDIDFEYDSITLVQSVLLMSFWSDRQSQDAHKQTWHWVNVAISLAQTIGLNQDPESLPLPRTKKSLRKRLWWCCFMRDRVIALYLSRPLRIQGEDFDVPLPTVEDMEIDSPSSASLSSHACCSHRRRLIHLSCYDRTTQVELAEIFISFLKLCIVIGTILSAQYSPLRPTSGTRNRAARSALSAMLFPVVHSPDSEQTAATPTESTISPLESTLKDWYDNLPRSVCFWDPQPSLRRPSMWSDVIQDIQPARDGQEIGTDASRPPSVVIQRAILHMCYYTAVSALHRSQNKSRHSQDQVSDSASNIAKISAFLNHRGLVRYLPVTAITMLVPSIISNALRIKKSIVQASSRHGRGNPAPDNDEEMARARDNVNSLLISLKTLQQVYVAADWVALLVEAMLNHARIRILVPQPSHFRLYAGNGTRQRAFELDVEFDPAESCKIVSARDKPLPLAPAANAQQSHDLRTDPTLLADPHSTDVTECAAVETDSWHELIDPSANHAFDIGGDESLWDSEINPDNHDSMGQWNFGSIGIDGFDENVDGMIPWDGTDVDWLA
ncbi:uncharacterized protein Z520_06055 [Fonsecaea multimorphosa CBS 102226]|uniref:Xylanolytic transcriptional activator regulatory domain-containing protein n=1 Tax=Fonsecaea multimorphosa CBS 102226 TaxID=1442371 RepID=A0A0D2JWP8_9EURO|nr:uncharacterized protein Z520_06055 [Fonsecaea multimorphosa CBS 102226]KIX97977.1 hypothetical protein Z520_06055 [Fonsecaea multimorphosa CBS 102226]